MKALVYNGPWDMSLAEFPRPEPAEGEALLKVESVGICGSDVHGFTGESGRRKPGMVMGHEIAGSVVEVNGGNSDLQVGDRVTVYNNVSCGVCTHCRDENEQRCEKRKIVGVNAGTWGAMAEFLAYPTAGLFKLDSHVVSGAALLAEPLAVGLHALQNMSPEGDDTIAIVGSGTIGMGLAMVLKAKGFQSFFALDLNPDKLKKIEKFGAKPIDASSCNTAEELRKQNGGRPADGAFEAVGKAETVRDAYNLLGPGGKLVIIGNLEKEFSLPMQGVTDQETSIRGSYGFTKNDFAEAVRLINEDSVPVNELISGYCTLDETPETMTRLARGEISATKIIIQP
jgi:L-iditol 2-dehydrogenase